VFPDAADGTLDDGSEFLAGPIGVAWHDALFDEHGAARRGVLPAVLRFAQDYRLLPDSYLLGLAWTMQSTSGRSAYFCGEVSEEGWPSYFPIALAIKTPIALLLLVLAGVGALVLRWARPRDGALLLGLLSFAAIHFAYVCASHLNIGQRHLLPIYPALYVLGGAAVAWWTTRFGRGLVAAAFVWLMAANVFIYPNYLSYFNESIGGPARGHLYLADSNIDWGQDLERLRTFMDAHEDETIKLSYFGSAVPEAYGFDGLLLPSSIDTGSAEYLDGGGTYVISVTELLGVYVGRARNHFWQDPAKRESYRQFVAWMEQPEAELSAEEIAKRAQASDEFARARWGRFLYELRKRPLDERIGWSMFVYRLSADDVVALTRP